MFFGKYSAIQFLVILPKKALKNEGNFGFWRDVATFWMESKVCHHFADRVWNRVAKIQLKLNWILATWFATQSFS